jgi:hypothetical protein
MHIACLLVSGTTLSSSRSVVPRVEVNPKAEIFLNIIINSSF